MVENSFFQKHPLQDLLSSLNAVISTNDSTRFITGHMIYTLAYNSRQQPPNIWYTTFPKGLPHKTFFEKMTLGEVFSPFLKTSFDFRLQVQQMHRDQDPGWPAQNSIHRQQKNQHNLLSMNQILCESTGVLILVHLLDLEPEIKGRLKKWTKYL